MNNIKFLERRWLSYKSKVFLMPLIKFAVLYLVMAVAYFFYLSFSKEKNGFISNNKTIVMGASRDNNLSFSSIESVVNLKKDTKIDLYASEVEGEKKINEEKEPEVQEKFLSERKKEELSLEPIIPIVNMQKEEKTKKHYSKHRKKHSSHLVKAKSARALTAKELRVIKHSAFVPKESKKGLFQSSSKNYIKKMQEKFSHSKQARDALLLAKAYYEKRDYKASEKWALRANKIDSTLDDSWFIFAKSKAKLGQKDEAIRILTHYYSKNRSFKIKQMIQKLKRDKI